MNGKDRQKMLETDVIGNNEWTRGFLCEADVSYLETFDSALRRRTQSDIHECDEGNDYQQLVEHTGGKMPTHCEHGIPLYEKCGRCRGFLSSKT
jgi:hypothetical protein